MPETFLRVLGPKPYRVAYVQPSRRPADGRYGDNPNRLYKHSQLQVILKPSPADVIEQYLGSLEAIGIDLRKHDIKFEEDNWEAPTLGAWGIGWQVMLDGLEITQFTYFQQCGGIDLDLVPAELTYGLERLTAFLQVKDSVYDIEWTNGFTYGDVRYHDELQYSVYNFEMADIPTLWKLFELHEGEAARLLKLYDPKVADKKRFPLLPTYDQVLKCSNLFNTLDARGAISVTERVGVIQRVRKMAVGVAQAWADQQQRGGGARWRNEPALPARNRHRRDSRLDDSGRARKPAPAVREAGDSARIGHHGCHAAPPGAARRGSAGAAGRQRRARDGPGEIGARASGGGLRAQAGRQARRSRHRDHAQGRILQLPQAR